MKGSLLLPVAALILAACSTIPPIVDETEAAAPSEPPSTSGPAPTENSAMDFFQITSPAFTSGLPIPARYSCDGDNISPALQWTEPPAGTQSLVLIMDDPDAPSGTWTHWVIFNLPPTLRGLPEAVPNNSKLDDGSLQGITSAGTNGYHGPCPPSGTHRYFFKLYALDAILSVDYRAMKDDVLRAMENHILANAELMGTYKH